MDQVTETKALLQSAGHFLIGFVLSIFLQAELHSVIRPTVGYYYGDFISYLFAYSLPIWRECAFFAVTFLAMAASIPKSHSVVARGVATCGLINALLLVAALRFSA